MVKYSISQNFFSMKFCRNLLRIAIDKLEKLNREIHHDIKNEKVAVIVENIQITEI